ACLTVNNCIVKLSDASGSNSMFLGYNSGTGNAVIGGTNGVDWYTAAGTKLLGVSGTGLAIQPKVSSFNGIATAGALGIPVVYGAATLTAQAASITATTAYAATGPGQ